MGVVSDIQRFSLHDGPGIRTTVFLKGCNLRCAWCHNPETISPRPQMQLFLDKCIACGACFQACQHGGHQKDDQGRHVFRREACVACGQCAKTCYAEGLVLVGREMSVGEVMAQVSADRAFYTDSGGGVTISGGEPLLQRQFTLGILQECRRQQLHTALETNLAWPWEQVREVLELTDLVMADIKVLDDDEHRRWTGASNERVLDNVRRVGQMGKPLIIRTPIVPGLNDREEAVAAIAEFLRDVPNLEYYELLAYHPLGSGKYQSLGMAYELPNALRPEKATMRRLAAVARKSGVTTRTADDDGHA